MAGLPCKLEFQSTRLAPPASKDRGQGQELQLNAARKNTKREGRKIVSKDKQIHTDELTKTKNPNDVQLTEEELSKAAGGAVDIFIKLNDVHGDSGDE